MTPYRLGTVQTVTVAGTTAASTNAFGAGIDVVRVISTTDCHITFGTSPTATTSDTFLEANREEYFIASEGQKIAVIQNAVGGTLYVTECSK